LRKYSCVKFYSRHIICFKIEEKAIEDLTKFYGIDQIEDEFILVERVLPAIAAAVPIWSGGKFDKLLKSKNKSRSLSMSDSGL
jgi:hypothetical protein